VPSRCKYPSTKDILESSVKNVGFIFAWIKELFSHSPHKIFVRFGVITVVTMESVMHTYFYVRILIIIIILSSSTFLASQQFSWFSWARVSLTKHFLFTVRPKTFWLYGTYWVLLLSALEYTAGRRLLLLLLLIFI
jgi:hypothetical protein